MRATYYQAITKCKIIRALRATIYYGAFITVFTMFVAYVHDQYWDHGSKTQLSGSGKLYFLLQACTLWCVLGSVNIR